MATEPACPGGRERWRPAGTRQQGRYWAGVARAWHQRGKPEACYRSLLAAERAAPAEVRYRPPLHRMTEDLPRPGTRNSLLGLRDFARRASLCSPAARVPQSPAPAGRPPA